MEYRMSTLELKELSHPAGEVIKIAAGKTLDLKSQGTTTLPTGSVLQVIQTVKTDSSIISSSSFTNIPVLSVAITPSSTSSKIYVSYSVQVSAYTKTVQLRILRDSTAIGISDAVGSRTRATQAQFFQNSDANHQACPMSCSFLDAPSSTSELTYKIQVKSQDGAAVYFNRSGNDADNGNWSVRTTSQITVMEIQG